jgi:hypothetical protein
MAGCDYMKEKFSVAMSNEKRDTCEECRKEITTNVVYKYNKRKLCKECWDNVVSNM